MEILLILVAIIAIACFPAFLAVIGAILSGIFWTVAFVVIGIAELVGYSVEVSGAKENPGIVAVAILALVVIIALVKRVGSHYDKTAGEIVAYIAVAPFYFIFLVLLPFLIAFAIAWGFALLEVAIATWGNPDRYPEAVTVMIAVNLILAAGYVGFHHWKQRKAVA